MSVTNRGGRWYVRILPYGELVTVATPARSEQEAREIERDILLACRGNDFAHLNPVSRAVCVQLFRNRKWGIPPDLYVELPGRERGDMTLWEASETFLNYPGIRESKERQRYAYALAHIISHFGKGRVIKSIWIPELRVYQIRRTSQGAAPATVNREISTLSALFRVLAEMRVVEANPCRHVKGLSETSSQRAAYLSFNDVERIANHCPGWYQPMIWMAYYTGMRRGEVMGLTRQGVDLSKRIITLRSSETKEGHSKRIPIRQELVPILEEAMSVRVVGIDQVFLLHDDRGFRVVGVETMKNPWGRALSAINDALTKLGLELWPEPMPRFHDLRHTWRANARRSGVSDTIAERVLGHADRTLPVSQRYGWVNDEELVNAVDAMTFEHGETRVEVAR